MAVNPAGGYNFNTFQEIKSHSSILYNERMAILFYLLDMKSINMNTNYNVGMMLEVRGIIKQIYKNIRMLIRNNPMVRGSLNLETKDPGIYITDIAMGILDNLIEYCESNGYTTKRIYIIVQELNNLEMLIKDVLQYYHYFIRPDFRQKPDVEIATERYKEIADSRTIEQLREIVGKRHRIDFENLGSERIEVIGTDEINEELSDDDEEEYDIEDIEDIDNKDDITNIKEKDNDKLDYNEINNKLFI